MEHVSDRIVQMIATKYKNSHPAIGHESRLSSDLAMDSLDKVNLASAFLTTTWKT